VKSINWVRLDCELWYFISIKQSQDQRDECIYFYDPALVVRNLRKYRLSLAERRFGYFRMSILFIKSSPCTWGVCSWSLSGCFIYSELFSVSNYKFRGNLQVEMTVIPFLNYMAANLGDKCSCMISFHRFGKALFSAIVTILKHWATEPTLVLPPLLPVLPLSSDPAALGTPVADHPPLFSDTNGGKLKHSITLGT
jgi:hypothetical protein